MSINPSDRQQAGGATFPIAMPVMSEKEPIAVHGVHQAALIWLM
jgi:hypothetical protein